MKPRPYVIRYTVWYTMPPHVHSTSDNVCETQETAYTAEDALTQFRLWSKQRYYSAIVTPRAVISGAMTCPKCRAQMRLDSDVAGALYCKPCNKLVTMPLVRVGWKG